MSGLQMYWFLKLDDIKSFCDNLASPVLFIAILLLVGFIIMKLIDCITDEDDSDKKQIEKIPKFLFPLVIIGFVVGLGFSIINTFTPSTKQMAAIYVVPKIVNNKQIQEIPSRMLTLATEWLEELRPENIKESAKTVAQQPQAKTAEVIKGK